MGYMDQQGLGLLVLLGSGQHDEHLVAPVLVDLDPSWLWSSCLSSTGEQIKLNKELASSGARRSGKPEGQAHSSTEARGGAEGRDRAEFTRFPRHTCTGEV